MLCIRMRKPGKAVKSRYHFKIVVTEKSSARDADFVEQIGFYDASRNLRKLDITAYDAWVKKGAQPSATVAKLYQKIKKQEKASV